MRNLPVALATLNDPIAFRDWTLEQCHITHNHPLSDDGTLALGRMVQRLVKGGGVIDCRQEAQALARIHPQFRFERYNGHCSAYIVDTIRTVLHFYFLTDSVRSCVIETVNVGGDADTAGAFAGMLSGATYGVKSIPAAWLRTLDRVVVKEIHRQVSALLRIAENLSPASAAPQ
jgi:ADP-ribosyl-[dinitrogen reductase] hydrolase